ncbi:MAG: hypothetical protein HKO94_08350 [Flavobacteriaceae bacterium]|nr:hypothetical protein [Flavobacteriaceae bacterium]
MKTIYSILLIALISTVHYGQQTIKGKITDYEGDDAEIILPVENPKIIGSVSENGKFIIQLEDEMASAVTETLEKSNAKSDIRIVNNSVGRAFYCDSDDVVTINGEQMIESVTRRGTFFMGILEDKKMVGKLQLANSSTFVDSYFSFGKKDYVTGYYIDFYYVNEAASVKGICKTKAYTLDMKSTFFYIHDYDIDLKKGWNIVKIEITEVYEDQEGHLRPLKYRMSTLDKLPKDVQYIFTPGDKL